MADETPHNNEQSPTGPAVDRHSQDHLGQQLRAMYEDLLQEPVPSHFVMLLARLEREQKEQGSGG